MRALLHGRLSDVARARPLCTGLRPFGASSCCMAPPHADALCPHLPNQKPTSLVRTRYEVGSSYSVCRVRAVALRSMRRLPQSPAYHTLKNRLSAVPEIGLLRLQLAQLGGMGTGGGNVGEGGIDWARLSKIYEDVQRRTLHREAGGGQPHAASL